jgi:hypothetical protein
MQNQYTSRDFYLSAYLIATGAELAEYERDPMGLTTFVFRGDNNLSENVRKFYALEALVSPVVYGNALRNLKSIIHANTKPNTNYEYNRKSE